MHSVMTGLQESHGDFEVLMYFQLPYKLLYKEIKLVLIYKLSLMQSKLSIFLLKAQGGLLNILKICHTNSLQTYLHQQPDLL